MSRTRSSLLGLFTWVVALLFFTPVAWMVLTSLHSEVDAATPTPNIFAGSPLRGGGPSSASTAVRVRGRH